MTSILYRHEVNADLPLWQGRGCSFPLFLKAHGDDFLNVLKRFIHGFSLAKATFEGRAFHDKASGFVAFHDDRILAHGVVRNSIHTIKV